MFEFYLVQVEIRTPSPVLSYRNDNIRLITSSNDLNGAMRKHHKTKFKRFKRVTIMELESKASYSLIHDKAAAAIRAAEL